MKSKNLLLTKFSKVEAYIIVFYFYYFILLIQKAFLFYFFIFFFLGTQSPKALNIKIEIYVWNGHGAASEIVNVSAKQTELNLCTATDNLWKRNEVSRGSLVVSDILLPMSIMNSNPVLHIGPKVSKAIG